VLQVSVEPAGAVPVTNVFRLGIVSPTQNCVSAPEEAGAVVPAKQVLFGAVSVCVSPTLPRLSVRVTLNVTVPFTKELKLIPEIVWEALLTVPDPVTGPPPLVLVNE
jgi:hypothetical protein